MSQLAIKGGKKVREKLFPAYNTINIQEKQNAKRVLDSGVLSRYLGCWDKDFYGGPEVLAFEKEWSKYFKIKNAISVNSCTSGLICALGACGIGPGDEVIVSPYSMSASATTPFWYGAIPVFADIEEDYFCIDPASVEKKITKKTKAIVAVDLFGQPFAADAIKDIAKKHNLLIIEDCAQAPGATYKNKFAGTLGDIGVYSLNYHKHIHTGEGGVVVTNDNDLAERVRLIRNHAEAVVGDMGRKDIANMIGQNYRLTEVQAAIGRAQLKKLNKLNKERISNCNYLAKKINKIVGIDSIKIRKDSTHVFYQQPFLYDESALGVGRDKFIAAVKAELPPSKLREHEGVLMGCGYVAPLYWLPIFQQKTIITNNKYPFSKVKKMPNYKKGICPVTEDMHKKRLFTHELMRPGMKKSDLDDVVKAFVKVYKYKKELT